MKKNLLSLFVLLLFAVSVHAQQTVGGNLMYATKSDNFGIGVKYQYYVADFIRLEPSAGILFKNDQRSAYDFNMNAHFVIHLVDELNAYPLVGANFSILKFDGVVGDFNRIGINFGAGLEYTFNRDWVASIEGKYVFIKDFDQPFISLGLAYKF